MLSEKDVTKLFVSIEHIRGKVDHACERLDETLPDHETRLREIEKAQNRAVGKASVLGSILGLSGGALAGWLTRHLPWG